MDNSLLLRTGKIAVGGFVTLAFVAGVFTGWLIVSPRQLFAGGKVNWIALLWLQLAFFIPYLFMSSVLQSGKAAAADGDEGVMSSYATQNAISGKYWRHLIAVVFGLIVAAICIYASDKVGARS